MTRLSVNRTLSRLYWLLTIVLLLLLAAKFADDIPGLPPGVASVANQLYEFMRDMSLLIATGLPVEHLPKAVEVRRKSQGRMAQHRAHQIGAAEHVRETLSCDRRLSRCIL